MSLLKVTSTSKSYGNKTVLSDVSLRVEPGTVTGLIGPSGSGKTTLLRSLNALEVPETGVVQIGDATVDYSAKPTSKDLRALRAQSGMVFQAHHLFPHRSALDNVIEGPIYAKAIPRQDAEEKGRHLLQQVGLAGFEDRFPRQLSGGQQQRVGIARALALEPQLLLFDEPTSALDPETVGEVLVVIRKLAEEGWTMLIVTHEIAFAREVADHVLVLDQGRIIEEGTATEILSNPQVPRTQQFLRRVLEPLNHLEVA